MDVHVNFEIAKLLKDKECVIKPLGLKNETDYVEGYEWDCEDENDIVKITEFQFEDHVCYFRYLKPTIAEVVMWIYKKYGIWIECLHRGDMGNFTFKVSKLKKGWRTEPHYIHESGYNSPTETYEAAIKYTLENLI